MHRYRLKWLFGLKKAFGSNAETWLRLQMNYDICQARKNASNIKVERYEFA